MGAARGAGPREGASQRRRNGKFGLVLSAESDIERRAECAGERDGRVRVLEAWDDECPGQAGARAQCLLQYPLSLEPLLLGTHLGQPAASHFSFID